MPCPIYQKPLGGQEKVVLGNKEAADINTWAEKKGHSLGYLLSWLNERRTIT